MRVADVMTAAPLTTAPNALAGDAAEILRTSSIRHLPVVEGGVLVGMLSDRDVRGLVAPRNLDADGLALLRAQFASPVSELMAVAPVTVHPEMDLSECIDAMLEHEGGALPVVEASAGRLAGSVSYVDLLRAFRDTPAATS